MLVTGLITAAQSASENVNLTSAPDWQIDPVTFNTLVELVRDIATRHNLLPLVVGKNLFGHKDVSRCRNILSNGT